jgi:hypothetical protein
VTNRWFSFLTLSIIAMGMLLLSGCVSSSGNHGKLKYNDDVKYAFEHYEIDPNLNYYYYGRPVIPQAVMGLSKDIILVSDFWTPIELTRQILWDWIFVQARRSLSNHQSYGSDITDDKGKKIGVWYSLESWQQRTVIEILGENKIKVFGPMGGIKRDIEKR